MTTCLVILTACGSGGAAPRPSPSTPGGGIASILCRTHRAQIQADDQALTVDEAAGDTAASAALRTKIAAAIAAARAIPGCDVDDLVPP